jgi:hypothetical protein
MLKIVSLLLFSACTGLFDGIYDEPEGLKQHTIEEEGNSVSGTLYIDASDWKEWFYIDLPGLANPQTRQQAVEQIQKTYPIPMSLTGESDSKTGIYTYWFDVWGKGLSVNEFREFTPTDAQTAPETWSLAVHRNNVRTHGGSAYETQYTDISQLKMSRDELDKLSFTADSWSETAVWTDQSQMLSSIIGSQGIAVNPVLSSWLRLDVPPMPPAFTHNNHVFVLRLNDGTYAALQLANYISPDGTTKCYLTIHYKYPL